MKIKYQEIALRSGSVDIIAKANQLIEAYQAEGYRITLRQLYYRFIALDLFPDTWIDPEYNRKHGLAADTKNTDKNYDRLGTIISQGRRAGLIDWDAIVDHTRVVRGWGATYERPEDAQRAAAQGYQIDLWLNQPNYIELWFEKDALLGVFERAAQARRLPLCSNRGYMSDSAVWEAAQRIEGMESNGKRAYVLHFGDHDPSGLDMTRDLEERFVLFGASPEVRRIALNMDQVKQYNPPPNPAKQTDCRFREYVRKYGRKSWELDSLEPKVMVKLVEREVKKLLNQKQWDKDFYRETMERKELTSIADNYTKVVELLGDE